MEYIVFTAAVLSGIHAYSYAKWAQENKQDTRVLVVYVFIAATVLLAAYNMIKDWWQ